MEGVELSSGSGRRRKAPNRLISESVNEPIKSKKSKKQQVHSNDELSLATVATPRAKKKLPEFSLGSDHDFMSPPKGDLVVVLALSADNSGEKKVGRSNSSIKTYRSKKLDLTPKLELVDKQKEVCVDLKDCLPISDLLHEPTRKKRSDRGKRKALESESKLSNSVVNQDSVGEKLDQNDGKTSTTDLILKVDGCTQVDLLNKSSEDVPSEIKKKKRSSQKNKLTLENGVDELPNALINNCSDHRSDEKIFTSSIITEVGHKVENDSTHQNSEIPIKKRRRSGQGKKLALESGEPKALVNDTSNQNLNEEKSNMSDGKISTSLLTAKVSHKADADTCELQNEEAPVSKGLEAVSRTADEHGEVHMVQSEVKKKRRSGQGKKLVLASGANKMPNSLANDDSDQNLTKERSDLLDGNISTAQVATSFSDKVAGETHELHNQDALVNKSLVTTSRTADTHEKVNMVHSDIKKKKRSNQGKKLALENGAPKALVNSSLDQNMKEEKSNLSDEIKSTPLLAAKVSLKGDADPCELHNQDPPVSESSEAAFRTAAELRDVCIVQSEIKKKRCSQGKKFVLASGANKSPNALVNGHSDQSLVLEKLNLLDGRSPTASLAAKVGHKVDCDTCELQKQDAPVNENSQAAFRNTDKHEEVNMVQSEVKKKTVIGRGKKHMSESERNLLSNTLAGDHMGQHLMAEKPDIADEKITVKSPIIGSVANHKVDNTTLCEVQNREVGVSKGSDAASQISNIQEVVTETRQERKKRENKHKNEKMEIGDVRGDDKGIGNFINDSPPEGRCASPVQANISQSPMTGKEKKHKKKKMKSTIHQANPSNVGEEVVPASLNESSVKEVASSIGDVRSDDVMIETQIIDDTLLKGPASPERAHTRQSQKKLLILDLNGLLVDIVCDVPRGCKADTWVSRKALLKRPFCDDFLKFCFETFNVGVWSSRTKRNVDTVVDFIMRDKRHKLFFCWDQSHCTETGFPTVENDDKTMLLKELRKVWNKGKPHYPWERGEYNESNTVLLDDSPYKALLNPRYTAIFPDSYDCRNRKDNALGPDGSLRKYLEGLATADNVQRYIEENPFGQRAVTSKNPSWQYYVNVMKANRFRIPV